MRAFEQLVADLLFRKGYWVTQSYKVELTKEERKAIGKPTSPRWEMDVIAYSPTKQELLAVECKSYLDSRGVVADKLMPGDKSKTRFKLFVDERLREVVFNRLCIQMNEKGLIPQNVAVRLALAVGKFRNSTDEESLSKYFKKKEWELFSPQWMAEQLNGMAHDGYFDSVAHVVSKLVTKNGISLKK